MPPDTTSKHVIKYTLELDEAEVARHAKRIEDSVNRGLGGKKSHAEPQDTWTPRDKRAPSAVGGASSPPTPGQKDDDKSTPKTPKDTRQQEKQAETVGEAFVRKLSAFFQRSMKAPAGAAQGAAQDVLQGAYMTSGFAGRIGGLTAGGGISGMATAGIGLAIVSAIALEIKMLKSAVSHCVQALGHFASGLLGGNPSSMLHGLGSLAKGVGIGMMATGNPAGIGVYLFGLAVGKLTDLMNGLVSTLGQYNASVLGQLRVSELMHKMLMMTIAQSLQPAMVAWTTLLQNIMGDMAKSPGLFKALNDILVILVNVLGLVWKTFAYAAEIGPKLWSAFRWLTDPAGMAGKTFADWIAPGGGQQGGGLNANANELRDRALLFNRGFLNAMPGANGNAGPGAAGNQPRAQPQMPRPSMPEFQTKVALTVQQNIMHEQAVQNAVEQIKNRLFQGLKVVRDETRLNGLMIDGHSAGYGL